MLEQEKHSWSSIVYALKHLKNSEWTDKNAVFKVENKLFLCRKKKCRHYVNLGVE